MQSTQRLKAVLAANNIVVDNRQFLALEITLDEFASAAREQCAEIAERHVRGQSNDPEIKSAIAAKIRALNDNT